MDGVDCVLARRDRSCGISDGSVNHKKGIRRITCNCSYCCFYTSLQLGNGKEQKSEFRFYVRSKAYQVMELIIKLFVQFYGYLGTRVFRRWHDNVLAGKVHFRKVASVLFLFAIMLGMLIYVQIRLSVTLFEIFYSGTLAFIVFLYGMTIMKDGFGRSQEDARVWMGWSLFWLAVTGFPGLLMELIYRPDVNKYLKIRIGAMVPPMFPTIYYLLGEKLKWRKSEVNL